MKLSEKEEPLPVLQGQPLLPHIEYLHFFHTILLKIIINLCFLTKYKWSQLGQI